jgi:hypothetical protein
MLDASGSSPSGVRIVLQFTYNRLKLGDPTPETLQFVDVCFIPGNNFVNKTELPPNANMNYIDEVPVSSTS